MTCMVGFLVKVCRRLREELALDAAVGTISAAMGLDCRPAKSDTRNSTGRWARKGAANCRDCSFSTARLLHEPILLFKEQQESGRWDASEQLERWDLGFGVQAPGANARV